MLISSINISTQMSDYDMYISMFIVNYILCMHYAVHNYIKKHRKLENRIITIIACNTLTDYCMG